MEVIHWFRGTGGKFATDSSVLFILYMMVVDAIVCAASILAAAVGIWFAFVAVTELRHWRGTVALLILPWDVA